MIVPIAPPFFSLASYVPASCQASLTMMGAQGFSWTSVVQSSQARRRFATRASPESGETTGEATVKLAPSTRKMDHVHQRLSDLAALIMVLVVIVGLSSSSFTFSSAQWRVPPPREQSVHLRDRPPPLKALPFGKP